MIWRSGVIAILPLIRLISFGTFSPGRRLIQKLIALLRRGELCSPLFLCDITIIGRTQFAPTVGLLCTYISIGYIIDI